MTFGCAIGYESDGLYGYIDFSCRPEASSGVKDDLINLDTHFYDYLSQAMQGKENHQQAIPYVQRILLWLASPLEIYDEVYSKVNLTFHERNPEGLAWALDHLCYFLVEHYPKSFA